MIVPNDPITKSLPVEEALPVIQDDPPPNYAGLAGSSPLVVAESSRQGARPRPTNFLAVDRSNSSIKESYVLDPFLEIPPALLPAHDAEGERKNLKLHSQNGSVNVDVLLVGEVPNVFLVEHKRTTLDISSDNGSVTVRLRTEGNTSRPRFHLVAHSKNGSVTVYLPDSFHGPLTLSTQHGSIVFSDELLPHVTTFSEAKNTKSCFIGDFSGWGSGKEPWKSDEATLTSNNGTVRVKYVRELDTPEAQSKGFFSRIFGL